MDKKTFKMTTNKAFSTLDPSDVQIECGKSYRWKWSINSNSADLAALPTEEGEFKFIIDSDCNGLIKLGYIDKKAIEKPLNAASHLTMPAILVFISLASFL